MSHRNSGPIPNRWLKCPRKANGLVADKFLAFKTPLGQQFNDKVPEECRFTPSMLFLYMKSLKVKLGLWIDLTNTSRFYDKKEIEDMDCKYVKIQCRGNAETPSVEQTKEFIHIVCKFQSQNPLDLIAVHCTHGFNRTGFLLISYMVEQLDYSLEAAMNEFTKVRPPGIYKQDYIQELYRRYDDVEFTPAAPARPSWCNEEEEADYDDSTPSNSQNHTNTKNIHRMDCKQRASSEQFNLIVEYMETNGDLSRPLPGLNGRVRSERQWEELANLLNSTGSGVIKTADKWKREPPNSEINVDSDILSVRTPPVSDFPSLPRVTTPPPTIHVPIPTSTSTPVPVSIPPVPLAAPVNPVPGPSNRTTREERSPTSCSSTPRRSLLRRRRLRQNPFDRATSEFVAVEENRLRFERERDSRLHQLEMERNRVDSDRVRLETERLQLERERLQLETERTRIDERRSQIEAERVLIERALHESVQQLTTHVAALLSSNKPN